MPLELHRLDIYQEPPPDDVALPLESGSDDLVWVRRAVWIASADRQPMQIQVSWLPGLPSDADAALRRIDPQTPWLAAIQELTGHTIASAVQHTRARGANPWEAKALAIPGTTTVLVTHATTYNKQRRPVEHSRYTWPTDAVRISDYYTPTTPT